MSEEKEAGGVSVRITPESSATDVTAADGSVHVLSII